MKYWNIGYASLIIMSHTFDTFSAFDKANDLPLSIQSSEIKTKHYHQGFELDPNTGKYKIKKGYILPITAKRCLPNMFFGYTIWTLEGYLSEGSTFSCNTKDCSVIMSSYYPMIVDSKKTGTCFGKGCMLNNWHDQLIDEYKLHL